MTGTHDLAEKPGRDAVRSAGSLVDATVDQVVEVEEGTAPQVVAVPGLARLVQPKLEVGAAGDAHEQEADEVARRVVSALRHAHPEEEREDPRPDAEDTVAAPLSALISRRATADPVGAEGGVVEPELEASLRSASSGGSALPEGIRGDMERAIGADFSSVRVHTDAHATSLNDDISARAFTNGDHIFFRDGLPDAGSAGGQELLAHELVHTVQQGSAARRSTQKVQRKGKGATALHPITDWVEFSAVSGTLGTKSRSTELKAIDAAVLAWENGARSTQGNLAANITQLKAILDAVAIWQNKNAGPSIRTGAVAALVNFVTPISTAFTQKALKVSQDEAVAKPLHEKFKSIDAETGKFAGKNVTDIKQQRFEPDNQTPGLMAHTKKTDDGKLTDEALDELDAAQIEEAKQLVAVARSCGVHVDPTVDAAKVGELMSAASNKNELTGRTKMPELANVSAPNAEVSTETTEDVDGVQVTYDKSDVHAGERLASLRKAIALINATKVNVPALKVYFPKYGRDITIANDCSIVTGAKIADAVFHPPNFLAVSSANTGNPKDDKEGTDLKFLSAALGPNDALVHTLIHEMGHALHYHNDRGRFYNLNFAFFKGKEVGGRSYQDIAKKEVSGYGSSPREMVAEVFVGAVTGKKKFSATVWEMYVAFGGADPR